MGKPNKPGSTAGAPTNISQCLADPVHSISGGRWRMSAGLLRPVSDFVWQLMLNLDRSAAPIDSWGTPTGVTIYGIEATVHREAGIGPLPVRRAVSPVLVAGLTSTEAIIGQIGYSEAPASLAFDLELSQFDAAFKSLTRGIAWRLSAYDPRDLSQTGWIGDHYGADLPS